MRILFGDYWVMGLLMADTETGHWRLLPIENPYEATWGGVALGMIPPATDTDEVVRQLGRDVHVAVTAEGVLSRHLVESKETFSAVDNPFSTRLSSLLGAPCRTYMAAPWKRPRTKEPAWMILGFPQAYEIQTPLLQLYETAVGTMARMASYPALTDYIERTEKLNNAVRRNIVHDLKTPLTVILGYMETLMMPEVDADPEMKKELSEGIIESCDRLLEDIKDLLEPIGHAWKPQMSEFDLAMLVSKTVLAERHTSRAKTHEIIVEGADRPLIVTGDLRKIRRVLENLISNAVKYSPGENKRVWITVTLEGDEVAVTVRDEGIGLDDSQMERVLTEAGRVVDLSLGIEGTGFGLASTRTVLEAHGGQLLADSCVGVGTTFGFRLPVAQEPETA